MNKYFPIRARKKHFECNIDAQFLWELWIKQSGKCALTGVQLTLDKDASLDRIDSDKGCITSNVWWVHKEINFMKKDLPLDRLIELCNMVVLHQQK